MKEVAVVFKRGLFSELLSSSKEDMQIICKKADRVLSCEDAIMIHWNNIEWSAWNNDYIHLMSLISRLDLEDERSFHYLEWDEEANHMDQMGEFFNNPWKTTLEGGVKFAETEKRLDLKIFF